MKLNDLVEQLGSTVQALLVNAENTREAADAKQFADAAAVLISTAIGSGLVKPGKPPGPTPA